MSEQNERYGRLVVISNDGGHTVVRCDCGTVKTVRTNNLHSGHTTSCGCYHSECVREANTRHGHRLDHNDASPEYRAWATMLKNCNTPSSGSYKNYGGLGIQVCEHWQGDNGFKHFLANLGTRPSSKHALSRRDKSKNFTPSNTCWATRDETRRNTRSTTMYTVGKRTQCLTDWAKEYDIPKNTLHYRVVTKGMSMRDALDVGRGTCGKPLPE